MPGLIDAQTHVRCTIVPQAAVLACDRADLHLALRPRTDAFLPGALLAMTGGTRQRPPCCSYGLFPEPADAVSIVNSSRMYRAELSVSG